MPSSPEASKAPEGGAPRLEGKPSKTILETLPWEASKPVPRSGERLEGSKGRELRPFLEAPRLAGYLKRPSHWEAPSSSAALPKGGARRGKPLEIPKPLPWIGNASKTGGPAKVRLKPSKTIHEGGSPRGILEIIEARKGAPRRPVPLESKPKPRRPSPLRAGEPRSRLPRSPRLPWEATPRNLPPEAAPEDWEPSKTRSRSPTEVREMPSKGEVPRRPVPPMLPARLAPQWGGCCSFLSRGSLEPGLQKGIRILDTLGETHRCRRRRTSLWRRAKGVLAL